MAPKKSKRRLISEELIERANSGRNKDVDDLLQQGADTEVTDWNGYTAISEAAVAGHTIVVGQLLRAAADPNAAAQDGRTALHRAAFHCWLPTVKLLVENGADPSKKDSDGRTAHDLARSEAVREYLEGVTPEQVVEFMEAHREKMALRPPGVAQEEALAQQNEESQPEVFNPPPRKAEEEAAEAAAKAAARAAKEAKAAEDAEAKREERYRRAIAELRAEIGEDKLDDISDTPPAHFEAGAVVVPRVAVVGAGEARLDGTYYASFVSKERVEFEKVGDRSCHIVWSVWHDEWRILIGDYKLGSTLYRHRQRPNIKFDECHGVPKEEWVKWFGAEPVPNIRYLAEGEEDYVPEPPKDEKPEGAVRLVIEEDSTGTEPRKTGREYMEMQPTLNIVAKPDDLGAARAEAVIATATGTTAHLAGNRPADIRLRAGDGQIVETSEGLFSSEEVVQHHQARVVETTPEEKAALWLEDTGDAPEVPTNLEAILAAKSAAQDLFNEGKVTDARQATTAAVRSLNRLLASELSRGNAAASKEELESLLGVLHSNRSLLLTNQIQAGDKEVLAFGQEAAWHLVVKDTDAALREHSGNFKASFRRAKALFELGDLDEAMVDASRVCDHYAKNSSVSNPEAAALRTKIMDAIKKERGKWGDKGGPRWNASSHEKSSLITELGIETKAEPSAPRVITSAPWSSTTAKSSNLTAGGAVSSASARRTIPAPRTGADVEKALLSTAKADPNSRLAYVKEHVAADAIKKFYRKTPLGPDLLGVLMRILAELANEDLSAARERLAALASTPSSRMHSAMFDAEERRIFSQLLSKVGSDAAAAWEDPAAPGGEGGA